MPCQAYSWVVGMSLFDQTQVQIKELKSSRDTFLLLYKRMSTVCRKRDANGHVRYEKEVEWRMPLYEFELEDEEIEEIENE